MADARRYFAPGPAEVMRKLLDTKQALPTDFDPTVQLSAEVRALRFWEEFEEGIYRWIVHASVGAVAAQFSGVVVEGLDYTQVPPRSLLTIDSCLVFAAAGQVEAWQGSGFPGANIAARTRDNRFGNRLGVGIILLQGGTNAAAGGAAGAVRIHRLSTQGTLYELGWVLANPVDADSTYGFFGDTVNTAIQVTLTGRVIIR